MTHPIAAAVPVDATVLVVDDDRKLVDLVRLYLARAGYRVLVAYDGETALHLADTSVPDLVVLDLMLPKMDGLDVCHEIRQRADIPVIMLTARSTEEDKLAGLDIGADDYVTKPFRPRELVARVRAVLRRKHDDAPSGELRVGDVVLDQAVRAAEATATSKSVSLDLRLPAGLPVVSADAKRVGQVLRNLIANALRHTPAGGQVTVAAETRAGQVRVSVCDTGEGIAPQHLPFVFERFYRADRSRARITGGAGIGLTIVKQFVEAHGGAVEAESQPGQGARFHFTLPLAPPLPAAAA